jgi:hypothetical protein
MTDNSIFDGIDTPKKKPKQRGCKCHSNKKQTVLWTVYHTVLALELLVIIIIEGIELLR